MRIILRHGATAAILAAAFGVFGSATAHAAAIPGSPAAKTVVVNIERTAADPCQQWDWWKYDSCRHDNNKCTFRADYAYYDQYGRYNEEGYYACTEYPKPTLYAKSS